MAITLTLNNREARALRHVLIVGIEKLPEILDMNEGTPPTTYYAKRILSDLDAKMDTQSREIEL